MLAGAITHIPRLSPILVNSVCTLTAGVFVLLTPFCTTYPAMVVTAAGYGLLGCRDTPTFDFPLNAWLVCNYFGPLLTAAFIALSSVIVCDLIGLEKLTNGFGLICLVRGMTAIAAPPFAGRNRHQFAGNKFRCTFVVPCHMMIIIIQSKLISRCFII